MELKNQICSLELANRLKDIGVKQESHFYWNYPIYGKETFEWEIVDHSKLLSFMDDMYLSAFTVAELSEMLPENIHIFMLKVGKEDVPTWFLEAGECNGETTNWETTEDKNQANAIAKMLIYLIENGLIKI